MIVTFLSNYINHHQIPFCNACYELWGQGFHFVQTRPMEQERLSMGWSDQGQGLPYVSCLYEQEEACRRLVLESDVLLAGWSDQEELVQQRLQEGKLTVRISERLYREGQWKAISPKGLWHKYKEHIRFRNSPAYLLCAGAYVASDFHLIGAYPGKMFKWGYFTQLRTYQEGELASKKGRDGKVHIAWAARLIPLKHPEYVIRLAKDLKELAGKGYFGNTEFHLDLIGGGELEPQIRELAHREQVSELCTFHGFQTPDKVRDLMEQSDIFLFTSNYLEGWGAVVNEAMNSGCAVVASLQAGAVPYLIEHGVNGLAYPDGDYESMKKQVCRLISDSSMRAELGRKAYHTIRDLWNADHAAKALSEFLLGLMDTGELHVCKEGPLSVAPVLSMKKLNRELKRKERRD